MKLPGFIISTLFIVGILSGCAKIGPVTGGPKDITPPKVVGSKPKNMATNFKGERVEITFDEFIKFKDKEKEFVTSPPFKKKPEVILRYKTVVVNFREGLATDRTYTLNFGNSITDNNEGNPIRDFEFVFSTGNVIDSLSFEGKVVNAFNHQPDKDGLFVMLYDVRGDSVPMKYMPAYTSRSNEMGFFRINHIKADTFMVVAIKDANNNSLYDPAEETAFSDSLLILDRSFYHAPDTAALKDTATSDSAYYSRFKPQMTLYSFTGDEKKQYLVTKERKQANQLFYNFNAPLDTFKIFLEGENPAHSWYLKEEGANRDSFTLWITDTTLIKKDTLRTVLIYPSPDSLNVLRPKYDTLQMVYRAPKERRKADHQKVVNNLIITTNTKDGFDLNNYIVADADAPLKSIDLSRIAFKYSEDSIYKPVKYTLTKDSLHFRRFYIHFKPVASARYSLVFDSLAISSIYNTFNDSTGFTFQAQKDDYYGAIKATITNVKGNIILQVLDEKEETTLKTLNLKSDQLVTIGFLPPGKYRLKVIHDSNGNGKWDTGNLIKRVQPEKVEYYEGLVIVRSNWDVELNWKLGE